MMNRSVVCRVIPWEDLAYLVSRQDEKQVSSGLVISLCPCVKAHSVKQDTEGTHIGHTKNPALPFEA